MHVFYANVWILSRQFGCFIRFEISAKDRPKIQRYEDDRMRRYKVDQATAEKYKKELGETEDVFVITELPLAATQHECEISQT